MIFVGCQDRPEEEEEERVPWLEEHELPARPGEVPGEAGDDEHHGPQEANSSTVIRSASTQCQSQADLWSVIAGNFSSDFHLSKCNYEQIKYFTSKLLVVLLKLFLLNYVKSSVATLLPRDKVLYFIN